jgi:hypothetical protein
MQLSGNGEKRSVEDIASKERPKRERQERDKGEIMKVSKAIQMLQKLNADEEIVIMYWAKDLFDTDFEANPISKDLWDNAVETVEGNNDLDNPSSEVYEALYNQLSKNKVNAN